MTDKVAVARDSSQVQDRRSPPPRRTSAGTGSGAAAAPKETLGGQRARLWVPGHPRRLPAETLTQQCGDPSARGSSGLSVRPGPDSDTSCARRRRASSPDRAGRGFSGRRANLRRGRSRERPGGLRVPGAARPDPDLDPARVEGACPSPTQSRPHSPFASVLLLRRHGRRAAQAPGCAS